LEPSAEPLLLRVHVDLGLDHLVVEVVALAGALADAGQHRVAAVGLGDVVDQLLHRHGLADAGAAEQADLAALGVGAQQVDHLDAGDQHLGRGGLLGEGRGLAVDRRGIGRVDRAGFVDRIADDVHDPAEAGRAHRNDDRLAGVDDRLAAGQALGGVHGDGAHGVLAQVLGHFQHQAEGLAGPLVGVGGLQRVQDRGQVALELDVDDGADDLHQLAGGDGLRGARLRRGGGLCRRLLRGRLGGGLLGGGGGGHGLLSRVRSRSLRRRR
jgi:peptide chain release factor 1